MRRLFIIALVVVGAFNTQAQGSFPEKISSVNAPVNIALEDSRKSFIDLPNAGLKSGAEAKSDFQVEFVNFPENAKSAFLYVLSIYEGLLSSDVPVKVQAKWESLGTNVLANTAPGSFYKNFSGAILSDVYYPVALAEKLSGKEFNDSEPDIVCTFNKNISWYLGTNGNTPSTQYDFVTVALHELVHGLGFSGFFNVENGVGDLKNNGHIPSVYDWYVYKNSLQVCDKDHFNTPSDQLKSALESGELEVKGNDGNNVESVYSPKSWNPGSSIYHYNESGFSSGDANALMTPYIFKGEAIHYPGDKTLDILANLGWKSLSFKGTQIKDCEVAVSELPVSVEVGGELDVAQNTVYLVYSNDNFASSGKVQLNYNSVSKKFEGKMPMSVSNGLVQYYYTANATNNTNYTSPGNAPVQKYSFRVGPDYYAPVLEHNAITSIDLSNTILDISAKATDNIGVKSVTVIYRVNGEEETVELSLQEDDLYSGQIYLPGNLTTSDVLEYRVLAVDNSSRSNKRYSPASGYYTVEMNGEATLTAADDVFNEESISFYPNPFQSSIYVDGISGNGDDIDIIVTDLYGKTVYRETRLSSYDQKIKVDLPNIAPGIYLASVTDNNSISISQKIVKN